ncbi:MAG: hypothetical protein ACI4P9_03400 [Selenomonadaceae bacterium]
MRNKVGFCGFSALNKKIYFSDIFSGKIVSFDIENQTYKVDCKNIEMVPNRSMMYGKVIIVGDNAYLAPRNATDILIYNVKNGFCSNIELKCLGEKCGKPLFIDMVKIENRLFLIPGRYHSIVEFNLLNNDIILHEIGEKNSLFTNCNVIVDGKDIYIYRNNVNMLCIFNVEDYKFKEIPLKQKRINALAALEFEDKMIFAGFGDRLIVVDKVTHVLDYIDAYIDCLKPQVGFGQLVIYDNNVYAIALNQPVIYKVDVSEQKIQKYIDFSWGDYSRETWEMFTKCDVLYAGVIDNKLIFFSTIRNSIIEVDLRNDNLKYYDKADWSNMAEYIDEMVKRNILINEGLISLTDFVEIIKNKEEL